ncbi:LLM class flavin-dependent oxidoreductase [Luteitalea sp.]|uniref:LLM class flavin-dependent oxidoreductase n=1 Tax=Luteitalea sp. TaxID=2004800 RepID=UPI0025BF443B|nr:LLM class flavin-dependent oxidoreductase [Luteitalea sp.]
MELGLTTFGDRFADPHTGRLVSEAQRMRDLLEEVVLADEVGLDVYAIGEHHRSDFIVSAPAVVLAAAAARTARIRLASAVTVLSSDDPVRVYQQYATVDLISEGRAEIIAGRGSFIESYPLFGQDLGDYDALFAEKLDLLLRVRASERVTWHGRHRPSIDDRGVYPRAVQAPLPVWVGVGGTPASADRAGRLGLPMTLAIIGGMPARFRPFVDLHQDAAARAGHPRPRLAINSHGYVAETSQQAADEFFPPYEVAMSGIGRERGWPPMTRDAFEAMRAPHGALFVGSAAEVTDKILRQREILGFDRFLLHVSVGTLPHAQVMKAIELFGTQVAPAVRQAL